MVIKFDPPDWAKRDRPANVRKTGSAAPEQYAPISSYPDYYDIISHDAQYGSSRRYGIEKPTLIVLHTTENEGFVSHLTYNTYRGETVGQTASYGKDASGKGVFAYNTPEDKRPWTNGRWNDGSLTLEIVGRAAWTKEEWLNRYPTIVEDLVRFLTKWCDKYNIEKRWLTKEFIAQGASRAGESPWKPMGINSGITDHWEANLAARSLGHDPGKYSHSDIGSGLRYIVLNQVIPKLQTPVGPKVYHDFMPDVPASRLYDSRNESESVVARRETEIQLYAQSVDVLAVLNVTVVDPSNNGWAVIWGYGDRPNTSSINFTQGTNIANQVIVPVHQGKIKVFSTADMDIIFDSVGIFV